MRVNRTVQWMREAAGRESSFVLRALEETATTSIYLATFAHWMFDESPGSESTRRFLNWLLGTAEQLSHRLHRRRVAREGDAPGEPETF